MRLEDFELNEERRWANGVLGFSPRVDSCDEIDFTTMIDDDTLRLAFCHGPSNGVFFSFGVGVFVLGLVTMK
jgi:hypothetical protein